RPSTSKAPTTEAASGTMKSSVIVASAGRTRMRPRRRFDMGWSGYAGNIAVERCPLPPRFGGRKGKGRAVASRTPPPPSSTRRGELAPGDPPGATSCRSVRDLPLVGLEDRVVVGRDREGLAVLGEVFRRDVLEQ